VSGHKLHIAYNFEGGYEYKMLAADPEITMDEFAQLCADTMVGVEVRPREGTLRVRKQEDKEPHPRDMKISETDWIDAEPVVVYYE
jgi:hypothetical protein